MTQTENYTDNNGVRIHSISLSPEGSGISPAEVRLLIVPGATGSAESIAQEIEAHITLPTTIVSIRGRGKSDSPETGYSLDEQASDIVAVCNTLSSEKILIAAHSLGVPMMIRASVSLADNPQVAGLVLCDFPPFYPPLDKSWADRVLQNKRTTITKTALLGLANDSRYTDVFKDLLAWEKFVGVLIPEKNRAIRPEDEEIMRRNMPQAMFASIEGASHELFDDAPAKTMQVLSEFAAQI